jgi:hypothetical protein
MGHKGRIGGEVCTAKCLPALSGFAIVDIPFIRQKREHINMIPPK